MIKDVIIENKKEEQQLEEGFYVDIEFMYGDADGYTNRTVGPFYPNQKEYLIQFLNMLEACLNAYPNGRGGDDEYEDVVEILKIWNFAYEEDDVPNIDKELEKVVEQIKFYWEYDICGYGEATIENYNVTYYDKVTGFHHVTLKKE